MNLLNEIKEACKQVNKDISEVTIIFKGHIIKDYTIFKTTDYNPGYGNCKIKDLQIIIDDYTWFERSSYDGAEKFELKAHPINSSYENKEYHYGSH